MIQHPRKPGYPALVMHSDGHIHHIHVRFKCAPDDAGCSNAKSTVARAQPAPAPAPTPAAPMPLSAWLAVFRPPALARRIPGATLNIRTGGHFMAHLHYREILDTLRRRSEG